MWGCEGGGGFCCSAPQYGRGQGGERRDAHRNTHTHTGMYMRMLHQPFSDLPLKKCPQKGRKRSKKIDFQELLPDTPYYTPILLQPHLRQPQQK